MITDEQWWERKIEKLTIRGFGKSVVKTAAPAISKHATHVFHTLCQDSNGCVQFTDTKALRDSMGIPDKFLWRALAVLTRSGVVRIESTALSARLVLVRERLTKRKPLKLSERARISRSERERLLRDNGFRCCRCGQKLSQKQMEVDHIVPLCPLGAEAPGNWAALCRKCNRNKWESFERRKLKWYRSERVHCSVGLRYVS